MAVEDYNEFEIRIIHRIAGIIDRGLKDSHDTQQIAEAVYLAWPEITDDNAANSHPKIPSRY